MPHFPAFSGGSYNLHSKFLEIHQANILVYFLISPNPFNTNLLSMWWQGFPCGSAGKESACNAGELRSITGLGRSPGEGKGYPLQYSGLENSMDSPWGRKESDMTEQLSLCGDKGHTCPQGVSTLSAGGDIKQGAHKTTWSILSQEKPFNLPTCQTCTHKTGHDDLLLKGGMEKPPGGPGSCGLFWNNWTEGWSSRLCYQWAGCFSVKVSLASSQIVTFHLPQGPLWRGKGDTVRVGAGWVGKQSLPI